MKKKNIVFIVLIVLIGIALIAYFIYGCYNPQSEGGLIDTQVEQAFAEEPADKIQEEWMANTRDYGKFPCPAIDYQKKLNELGFESIYEKHQYVQDKNAEYADKEVNESLTKFISDEDKEILETSREIISNAQTVSAIQEHEANYQEVIDNAEKAKKEEEERIAAEKKAAEERARKAAQSSSIGFNTFMRAGVVNWNGYKFTYYSQSVLPGGGLRIPGRHVDGGFVKDGDGYIVLANSRANGTIIQTPWGAGKIYDKGTSGNHIDVYVR